MKETKTREMTGILQALKIDRSALIALATPDSNIVKSSGNIVGITAIQARQLNVGDLLAHRTLIIPVDAVRAVEGLWGTRQPEPVTG